MPKKDKTLTDVIVTEKITLNPTESPSQPLPTEGKINWFKLIPPEHLYFNKDKRDEIEKRLGKTLEESNVSEGLESELVIKLSGVHWLLNKRGYEYAEMKIDVANKDFAAATCKIKFTPNDEDKIGQIFTGSASAHAFNTKSWYKNYLTEAASNRALCRATRFYLGIFAMTAEELGANTSEEVVETDETKQKLQEALDRNKFSFEQLKDKMVKEKIEGAENFKSIDDIPRSVRFNYIGRIKKMEEEKKKKEA